MGQSNEKFRHSHSITKRLRETPFVMPLQRDIEFLSYLTNLSAGEVKTILDNFIRTHPSGLMNKKEFCQLYVELRKETNQLVEGLTENVFKALGVTGTDERITLNEFLITFALTTRGDAEKKLEYAFEKYAYNMRNFLDEEECREVIYGIIEILSNADSTERKNIASVASDCWDQIETTKVVTKENFIHGLCKNKHLVALMQPYIETRTPKQG